MMDVKLSVKIRIGYKEPENYVQIGKIAEEVGCDHITVHGRTREQLYSGKADWSYIKEVKDNYFYTSYGKWRYIYS